MEKKCRKGERGFNTVILICILYLLVYRATRIVVLGGFAV